MFVLPFGYVAESESAPPSSDYEPETDTLIAALTGSYDGARQTAINTLISTLKADGVWSKLDQLCIVGLNSSDSVINWKSPGTLNASIVGSPTFTADRGFTVSSSNVINTNISINTASINHVQNSCSFGYYCRTNNTTGPVVDMGFSVTGVYSEIAPRWFGSAAFSIRTDTTVQTTAAEQNTAAFFAASRTGSTSSAFYRNSTQVATSSNASVATGTTTTFTVGGRSSSSFVSNRQYAMWFIGGGLTATEEANLYNAIQDYMTAIGANV
jgi:hypothetical protein